MGVFEKLPYLNYHDINLDWLVRQTKKNASDNTYLMKIFKWFQDHGLVGVVTEITENPDDTVKIEYTDTQNMTTDDFTVYDKTGADNAISGAQSAAESYADGVAGTAETNAKNYADNAAANALKSLGNLTEENALQATDLLLINRSGAAKAIAGDKLATASDITTILNSFTNVRTDLVNTSTTYITSCEGWYIKIGRLVFFTVTYIPSVNLSTSVEDAITGLPAAIRRVSFISKKQGDSTYSSDEQYCNINLSGTISLKGPRDGSSEYSVSGCYISAS